VRTGRAAAAVAAVALLCAAVAGGCGAAVNEPRAEGEVQPSQLLAGSVGVGQAVVVIDPGHDERANLGREPIGPGSSTMKIKDGGGATGIVTGQREPVFNLAVARRLRTLLQRVGVRIVMTRTTTAGVSMGNVARARIANRAHADLFLRIHADGSTNRSIHGTHTLVPALHRGWTDDIYSASLRAGRTVQGALVRRLGSVDRGLDQRSDITGFNWANVPAILVESGFLSNPAEDRLLASPSYRRKIARGLCEGTLRFLGLPVRCA
jgi:N-acetylmuramoyl-L-alanine amidase